MKESDNKTTVLTKDENKEVKKLLDESENISKKSNKPPNRPPIILIVCALVIGCILGSIVFSSSDNFATISYNSSETKTAQQNQSKTSSKSSKSSTSSDKAAKENSGKSSSAKSASGKSSKSNSSNSGGGGADDPDPDPVDSKNNKIGNSPNNIINGGFLAKQNDTIYYQNSKDNNCIYSKSLNDDNENKVSFEPASCINVANGYIYAKRENNNDQVLKMKLDGNVQNIINIGCKNISVNPNLTISSDQKGIYRIDNSVDRKIIYIGNVLHCSVYKDQIYFIENDTLYGMDLNGKNRTIHAQNVQTYCVGDDGLFYVSFSNLYSIYDKENPIKDLSISCVNITNGNIYFGNEDDDGKVYKVSLNGSDKPKLLSNICPSSICVVDDIVAIKSGEIITIL